MRDALDDPSVFPHAPDAVDLVETHISLVALVPPYVYKVKKPVDLGFLDFTTLEARKRYCEREVALNRRLCEGVYEAVVPVVETADGVRVDPPEGTFGPADVVDWAVQMRYMQPEFFLHRRLQDGRLPDDAIDRVADTLCAFYREQSPREDVAEAGWIEQIRVSTDENFEQTRSLIGEVISRPAYDALREYVDLFFDANAALFHRRRAEGCILNCHGDLRLEHVHLTDDRVCIYDCIEFNDRFRHVDVANDVAFLAMDLDAKGRPDLARQLTRRVAEALDDPEMLHLLPFYKCYRAYVRGKVDGMRAAEDEVTEDDRTDSERRGRGRFQQALGYAVAGDAPLVLVVMGRSGTGKTTQADALASALGWAHLSSDRIRKTIADVPLHERPDAETRAKLYAPEMSAATYEAMRTQARDRARQHESTILDATYSRKDERDALREALQGVGVRPVFVELTAPDERLQRRLKARDDQATVSDARAEDFELLNTRYEAPSALEDARHVRVDATGDVEATTAEVLRNVIRLQLT